MSMDISDVVARIDWHMLREQKAQLVSGDPSSAEYKEAVEGLVSLIDALQDAAVDSGVVDPEEVFGIDFAN